MAAIREELILADYFSSTLNMFTRQMEVAARMAQSGYANISRAAEAAAQAQGGSMVYVRSTQEEVARVMAQGGMVMGNNQNIARMYAQEVLNSQQQTARFNMELMAQSRLLSEVAAKNGEGSLAARTQAEAVNAAAMAVEQSRERTRLYARGLEEAAGSSKKAAQMVDQLKNSAKSTGDAISGLTSKVKGMIGAFLGVAGLKTLVEMSDTMAQTTARIDLMNDGLQTTKQYQDMLLQSAQRSRGAYADTADMVAKLGIMAGDAFGSNQEVLAFAEQINKQFTISGTNTVGRKAAMLQLTQAMAMGVLRGQELRSVMQQVPTVIQAIAQYLGVSTGEVKKMADEGLITASVVKNAMFATAEETNAKFKSMPMTWAQVWTSMQNTALMALQPVLTGINWLANHLNVVAPIAAGAATAIGILAVALAFFKIQTWLAVAANQAFMVSLFTNPFTWIIVAIAAVIAWLYQFVQSVGGVKIAWAMAVNAFWTGWDKLCIMFASGVAFVQNWLDTMVYAFEFTKVDVLNALGDLKVGALNILQGMLNKGIDLINQFISKANQIPGVSIPLIQQLTFATTSAIDNEAAKQARNASLAAARQTLDSTIASRQESIAKMEADAWSRERSRLMGIDAMRKENALQSAAGPDYGSMVSPLEEIAGDTGKIARSVDASDEDLKLLEDVAIRRYEAKINSTQLTPNITVHVSGGEGRDMGQDIAKNIAAILAQQLSAHTTLSYSEVLV